MFFYFALTLFLRSLQIASQYFDDLEAVSSARKPDVMYKLIVYFNEASYRLGRDALSHRFPYREGEWYDANRSRTSTATQESSVCIWLNESLAREQIVFLSLGRDAGLIESYAEYDERKQLEEQKGE